MLALGFHPNQLIVNERLYLLAVTFSFSTLLKLQHVPFIDAFCTKP